MSTNIGRETAKIYTFPAGGRAAQAGRLGGHFGLSKLEREVASMPHIVYGDSWYHDAAIADADETAGKH